MTVIVAGSREIGPAQIPEILRRPFTPREITDIVTVLDAVEESALEVTEVISGCAPGVDTAVLMKPWACPVRKMPANWTKFGNSAGVLRNVDMAAAAGPQGGLVAVWNGESRGTRNMISIARARKMKIFVQILGRTSARDLFSEPPERLQQAGR